MHHDNRDGPPMWATISLYICLISLATMTIGCGGGAVGQLRVGADCAEGDQSCMMSGLSAPLAVGASLRPALRTTLRGSGSPAIAMWSAAPSILSVEGSRIIGQQEGVSAVIMKLDNGAAVDFVHVWVKRPDRLQLHRKRLNAAHDLGEVRDAIELVVGENLWLTPRAYAQSQPLLGEGPTQWQVEPAIAQVLRDGRPGMRRLRASRAGQATVTVTSLGLSTSFQLSVHAQTASARGVTP